MTVAARLAELSADAGAGSGDIDTITALVRDQGRRVSAWAEAAAVQAATAIVAGARDGAAAAVPQR